MSEPVRVPPFSALRALEAVARLRGVTAAARELQLSHPAVSQALSRLEAELGKPLFSRTSGGPVPTEIARELIGVYNELVARVRRIYQGQVAAASRPIRVCAAPVLAHFWFPMIEASAVSGLEFHIGGEGGEAAAPDECDITFARFTGSNHGGYAHVAPERLAIAVPASEEGERTPSVLYTAAAWRSWLTGDLLSNAGLGHVSRNVVPDPGVCLALAEAHAAACLFDEQVLRLPRYRQVWRIVEQTSFFTGCCYGVRTMGDVAASVPAHQVLAAWKRWVDQPMLDTEAAGARPAGLRAAVN